MYCAVKHALEGLTRATAGELALHGIRVNAVAPTFVDPPMTKPFLGAPGARDAIIARIPLGRLGTAEEVAEAIVWLLSPAATYVSGAIIAVTGGR